MNGTEIAIVGMAGRYPKAPTIAEFWRKVCAGEEFATFLTEEEMRAMGVDEATIQNPNWVRAAGMLESTEEFDAAFFGYNPKESSFMDPQQRHFLEVAWEALEDAGIDPDRWEGSIGVFGGSAMDTYLVLNIATNPQLMTPTNKVLIQVGNDNSYLTTRVSYKLNLKGPSHTLQCACSTSLVATHLACQSLLNDECDMALVGGATVHAQGKAGYQYLEGGVAAPDGKCRTFDAQGRGPIFNSGVGVVALKRYEDAVADRDHIYAIIRGTAINNDGSLKVSYAAPSVAGQAEVISEALAVADVEPDTIGYVEAHGTATPLGDPIEVQALTQAYRARTDRKQFCGIGSVKSNVGHLDAAAGVTSLMKSALSLKHKILPASLHFTTPNPQIDFANSPFRVVTSLTEWQEGATPRRAGVSSFGIGGTNAHAILEEAPPAEAGSPSRPYQVLMLSARTGTALDKASANLAAHLRQHPDLDLADVAYTLQIGRKSFDHRRVVLARDGAEAIAALESGSAPTASRKGVARPVVFMFSGQGAQYPHMARELYESESEFRAVVDECCALLQPHLGLDLRTILLSENSEAAAEQLRQTAITQPALFVVEYALARLWMSWGIEPEAMIGHSIGEYVAACLAEVFSLKDALALVAARGKLMQSLPAGGMLAVPMSEGDVQALLGAELSLAAVNEPGRCVISGPTEAIQALQAKLEAQGIQARPLHTSHAFHSAMMEPILKPFAEQVARVPRHAPTRRFVSNVTGTWITEAQATDPEYWTTHLRQAVRFADGVATLAQLPSRILLEVGPGRTLATLASRHPAVRADGMTTLASLRHPDDSGSNEASVLSALSQLWLAGVEVDWTGFYADEERYRVPLPTYPWERQRYWIEPGNPTLQASADADEATTTRNALTDWFYIPSWQRTMPPVAPNATEPSGWLLFVDECGMGSALAERLRHAGEQVVEVSVGKYFAKHGAKAYTIDPAAPEDYDALLHEIAQDGIVLSTIAHLWSVTQSDSSTPALAQAETQQRLGFYSLLFLAQALGRRSETAPVSLRVLSSAMQAVAGETQLESAKATLLGPCRVIPQEYAHLRCQSIDLLLPEPGSWQAAQLLDQLVAELRTPVSDPVIAYRGPDRWAQRYEPTPLGGVATPPVTLREGGVYLLTGGLGGIGLELAHTLAHTVRAKLVLVSRSGLREEQQPQVATLEAAGAEVLVLRADVTSEQQMVAVVAEARARFGALHGVLHAAGVPGGGIIQLKRPESAASVLAPKVAGTLVLQSVLAEQPLDFFCLFSSITAVTGGFGQVDYCGANSFLDAFAHASRTQPGPLTVSVNWDAWQKVGMAVNTQHLRTLPGRDAGEAVGHPLLHRYHRESEDKATFTTRFSAQEHWVLSEHRVMGKPTIPGATYPEVARAALVHHTGAQAVEIAELLFVTPFMVGEEEQKEMTVTLERQGEGWAFAIASGQGASRQPHVRGLVRERTPVPAPQHDLAAILGRCTPIDVQARRGEGGMAQFVDTGARWECIREVHAGTGEGVAVLELSPEFAADTDLYRLHPTLMDIATAFAIQAVGEGNYLPLAYGQMTIHGPLTGRIFCYVRVPEQGSLNKESVMVDVRIMDAQGVELVDIRGFSVKRVAGDAAQRLLAAAQAAASAQSETTTEEPGWSGWRNPADGILPEEGVEAFMRLLALNRLPQVIVSTRDLQTTIREVNAFDPRKALDSLRAAPVRRTQSHPRPHLDTPYTAPRTPTEEQIAQLWQEVLGLEQVGVHDNFFALGGDSLLGTQIMAKAKEFGLEMTPAQFFQYQTVAELAGLVEQHLAEKEGERTPTAPITVEVAEEEKLLANLDNLSEEEMDALLAEMAEEESGA